MSRAFEVGVKSHPWWLDWRGESVAIVASGPSVKSLDLSTLKDRIHVIAIKTNVDLCPWAEVCYGCDDPWWVDRKGLPNFHGVKLSHGIHCTNQWKDIHRVKIDMQSDEMLVEEPLKICNGGNSGLQAINIAVQFGVKDVILVGFDLHERGGKHWYGRNKWLNANNPERSNFNRWQVGFEIAKKSLDKMGVSVINASPGSELKNFPKMSLGEAMESWGL